MSVKVKFRENMKRLDFFHNSSYFCSKEPNNVPHTICNKTVVIKGGLEKLGKRSNIFIFWWISPPSTKPLSIAIFSSIMMVKWHACSMKILN